MNTTRRGFLGVVAKTLGVGVAALAGVPLPKPAREPIGPFIDKADWDRGVAFPQGGSSPTVSWEAVPVYHVTVCDLTDEEKARLHIERDRISRGVTA